MEAIHKELGIENYRLSRIDVAINTDIPYDDIYKINKFVKELYADYLCEDNAYYSNGDDFSRRSMKVTNRNYELEVYNKELESKGVSPYKTRIEFRYKRLRKGQDFKSTIDQLNQTLLALPKNTYSLEEKKCGDLLAQYAKEQSKGYEGRNQGLTNFVAKYADDIFTNNILKGLYSECCTGECKSWLYQYYKGGKTLTLYTKKDLICYLNEIILSTKAYSEGICNTSPFALI